MPTPRRSGYITRMDAWLVDDHGPPGVDHEVMLHHIVFINSGRPGGREKRTSCPGARRRAVLGNRRGEAAADPARRLRLPGRQARSLVDAGDAHEPRAAGPHACASSSACGWSLGARMKRVKPLWLRANGCTTHPATTSRATCRPAASTSRQHLWRMPLSGRIVATSAHLHGSSYGMTVTQPRCGGPHARRATAALRISQRHRLPRPGRCCTSRGRSRPATTCRRPASRFARARCCA